MTLTQGRLLALKTLLHLCFLLPLLYLAAAVQGGAAGGDPVQYVIHFLGMGALHGLMASLLVSPLARWWKLGALVRVRRLLGLWTFAYALLHLGAFLVLDLLGDWALLLSEVVRRPYIVVGMLALLILTALALTSTQGMQRRLGRRWQRLHNWVYLVALLAPVHFWWSVKSGWYEPALYLMLCLGLLALRPKLWNFKSFQQIVTNFNRG
ncbi:sulfoxide reductase heme-binding subunit YedZ [Ferrimonas sediminum]|uniref:Protein-methionine-sulfoxide reductase heme-binding subunit MsrQ n=1 Tax=Ferrimonas sediminum TaxID=718193 RepID=A0A1G8NT49_9GAMM|nr:protein-methionine-sulfoxide reductase heme-binding subunit MsrQ [Ferrimonas sediminum]SDI83136.1 sulfoxide reductase heme-binding subunit YedZ [Ferrimonas sediminum]